MRLSFPHFDLIFNFKRLWYQAMMTPQVSPFTSILQLHFGSKLNSLTHSRVRTRTRVGEGQSEDFPCQSSRTSPNAP